MAYRLANAAWCMLLLYAVAVQYNDPDPVRWMFAYGVGAAFAGYAAAAGAVPIVPPLVWAAIASVAAIGDFAYGSGQTDPMGGFPHWGRLRDEIVRETLGLLLMAGWMVVLAWWTRRRQTTP
ncbi:MAG: transmembrane 220 family protein [Myxococcota bacterium]